MSKKDIKNKIKKLKQKIIKLVVDYIKNNRLFLCFILLSLINCFFIRVFTVGNYNNIKTI